MPGCSLEISAGRQTKIELINSPSSVSSPVGAPVGKTPAEAEQYLRVDPHLPVQRFAPRLRTPLSFLAPRGSGSAETCGSRGEGTSTLGQLPGLPSKNVAGAEVDFVGCVLAVTVERPSSSPMHPTTEEIFATVDSIARGNPAGCGGAPAKGGRSGPMGPLSGQHAGGAATVAVASTASPDKKVTYRVYLTDASGACVALEKRIKPNLARHHRIFRSAPGSCWAIVNAGGNNGDGGGDAALISGSSTWRMPPSSCHGRGRNLNGYRTVTWSSMTAVGGNGSGTPPRSIGGAPAGHLGSPLLEMRRWADGGEGRRAVHRERQRLELLLAREQRLGRPRACATAAAPEVRQLLPQNSPGYFSVGAARAEGGGAASVAAAQSGDGGDGASGEGKMPGRYLQGQQAIQRGRSNEDAVVGFVSSFSVGPAASSSSVGNEKHPVCGDRGGDAADASLCLNVDTGERLVSAVLPLPSLRQLLGLTLRCGDRGQSSAVAHATAAEMQLEEPCIVEGVGGNVPAGRPASHNDAAHGFLARAVAILGEDRKYRCRDDGSTGASHAEHESSDASSRTMPAATSVAIGENGVVATPPVHREASAQQQQHPHQSEPVKVPSPAADDDSTTGNVELFQAREGAKSANDGSPDTLTKAADCHSCPVSGSSQSSSTTEALASVVCRMVSQEQHRYDSSSAGLTTPPAASGRDTAATIAGCVTLPPDGTEPADCPPSGGADANNQARNAANLLAALPAIARSEVSADPRGGSGPPRAEVKSGGPPGSGASPSIALPLNDSGSCYGGGVGTVQAFLDDLAAACGRSQVSLLISRRSVSSFSGCRRSDVRVVEGVGPVDVARSTRDLLEDLAGGAATAALPLARR